MSWAEALRDCFIAICVAVVLVHLYAGGFSFTVIHKERQGKAGKEE